MTQSTATPSPTGTPGGAASDAVAGAAEALSGLVETVQSAFPTAGARLAATVLAAALALALVEAVRRAGPVAKARFDDRDLVVETLQAWLVGSVATGFGLFALVVWRRLGFAERVLATPGVGSDDVLKAVFSLAVVALAVVVTRVTKRTIRRVGRDRSAVGEHQTEIVHHVVQVSVYVLALVVVFGLWGLNPGSLLVGAGFAGIVLGLAARQTLGAVLAGFVVLFSRPFELGDWVEIGEREGVVTDITIVNTQLRTFDDEYVMIPNDVVANRDVINRSRKGRLRLSLDVGVDYDTDLEAAVELAEEAMHGHDVVLETPRPHVVCTGFGDSAVGLRLRFYIDNPSARKMWKARTAVTMAVKSAFEDAGVKIPYPQRELSGRAESGGFRPAGGDVESTSAGGDGSADGGGVDG